MGSVAKWMQVTTVTSWLLCSYLESQGHNAPGSPLQLARSLTTPTWNPEGTNEKINHEHHKRQTHLSKRSDLSPKLTTKVNWERDFNKIVTCHPKG